MAADYDAIVTDAGGRARIPEFPGLEGIEYLTNSSMMEVDFVPPHLLIVGGSDSYMADGASRAHHAYRTDGQRVGADGAAESQAVVLADASRSPDFQGVGAGSASAGSDVGRGW